ncbi:MAG: hypothetical protein P4M11_06590 [Candidatus Pacebacteria bacterium]|nr:hypothetical protein [Candidatus Paceibacterota bacterium]
MTAADAKTEGGSYMIRDNAGNVVRAASSPEEARKLQAEESENAREAA